MKTKIILLATVAAGLWSARPVLGQYREQPANAVSSLSPSGETSGGKAEFLAGKLGIPAAEIAGLRAKNVGWDDLVPLLVISKWSREKSEVIWAQKQSGLSWRKIAETYNLDNQALDDEIDSLKRDLDAIQESETIELPPPPQGSVPPPYMP